MRYTNCVICTSGRVCCAWHHLFYLRKLYWLKIDVKIMNLFYQSVIQSTLSFCMISWYGNCPQESKDKLNKIINSSKKIGVTKFLQLYELFETQSNQRINIIMNDPNHPLYSMYEMLPSGRRLRAETARTSRYCKSFVPSSIRLYNSQ